MRTLGRVADLGVTWPEPARLGLKALAAHRSEGRWRSNWKHHAVTRALIGTRLRAAERRIHPDVVLQIGDLARTRAPFLLYQDLSIDLVLERIEHDTGYAPHFPGLDAAALARRRAQQREIYRAAAGVLAMSHWLGDHLVRVTGLPAERVHVVNPGANVLPDRAAPPVGQRPRRRLLLVGKDFHTKAGDVVVAALALLRRDVDPEITLTVAGPRAWPLPGEVPDGVRFLGPVPVTELSELYFGHDLMVMPSRFEGFGIAFAEALAHGLPCVARDDCAMPEIVRAGVTGALVRGDDPDELAKTVAAALADDELHAAARAAAAATAEHYTWDRAARQVLAIAGSL
jgi:glycosyltransferase involved in cell wall biosynthesis